MELRQLRYFLMVAEQRSFGRAAKVLGVTQQTLSHSIGQLEKGLRAEVFVRAQTGVELTPVGDAFAKRARLILSEAEIALREADVIRTGKLGSVRFGVSPTLDQSLLGRVVSRFAEVRPNFGLTLVVDLSAKLYEQLLVGQLELVVAAGSRSDRHEEIKHEPLTGPHEYDANFLLMRAEHPLLKLTCPSVADIVRYPWIMPERAQDFVRDLFDFFAAHGVQPPKYILRTDSFWGSHAVLTGTDFVAWMGREPADAQIRAGMLGGFPIPGLTARREYLLSTLDRSPLQPPAAALAELFRRTLKQAGVSASACAVEEP